MKQELYDYQLLARERKREALGRYGAAVCVAPCGAGKGTMIADDGFLAVAKDRTVQVTAHRRILVQQLAERLKMNGVRYSVQMSNLPDKEWAVVDDRAPIIISTSETAHAIIKNGGTLRKSDIHIVDECHLPHFRKIHDAIGARWLLGYTASPVDKDGYGLDEATWRTMVEAAKIEELIDKKKIVPVEVYVPVSTAKRRKAGLKISASGDPVQQWLSHANGLRTATFCANVSESKAVRDAFLAEGIPAEHVDADTPDGQRDEVLQRLLRRETLILCNVGIAEIGWDFPALECVQLLTKCGSPPAYWQKIGRSQRIYDAEGKTRAVLLDHTAAMAEHGWPNWSPVWSLSDRDPIQKKQQERFGEGAPVDAKPIICNKCGRGSIGLKVCPSCGNQLFRDQKCKPETGGEKLSLIADAADFAVQGKNYQKEWTNILYMAANHPSGPKSFAWAAAIFKNKFHDYPEKFNVTPTVPYEQRKQSIAEAYPQYYRRRSL